MIPTIISQPSHIPNPLVQNFQIPANPFQNNTIQHSIQQSQQSQQFKNSQQLSNDYAIRNSLPQAPTLHPLPQFNSKYTNIIQPSHMGYPMGY